MKATVISLFLALSLVTLSDAKRPPILGRVSGHTINNAIDKRSTFEGYTNDVTYENVIRKSSNIQKRKEPEVQEEGGDGTGQGRKGKGKGKPKGGEGEGGKPAAGGVLPALPAVPDLAKNLPALGADGLPLVGKGGLDGLPAVGKGLPALDGLPAVGDGLPKLNGLPAVGNGLPKLPVAGDLAKPVL